MNTAIRTTRSAPLQLIEHAHKLMKELISDVSGVEYMMLCSTDGFELKSIEKKNIENSGKLAAVSSSILAMVQAFTNEINLVGCQTITLDAKMVKHYSQRSLTLSTPMILVVLTSKNVLLGQLLYSLKRVSNELSEYQLSNTFA
jgi:Uncharacterized distant relative of homeotic protein bithoraxoid